MATPFQYQFQEQKKLYIEEGSQSTQAHLQQITTYKKKQEYLNQKTVPSKLIKKFNFSPDKIHSCFSRLYKA